MFRPGDWVCDKCRILNFGGKAICFKCKAPNPKPSNPGKSTPKVKNPEKNRKKDKKQNTPGFSKTPMKAKKIKFDD